MENIEKVENLEQLLNNEFLHLKGRDIVKEFYDNQTDYGKAIIDNLIGIAFNIGQLTHIKLGEKRDRLFNEVVVG